MAEMEYKYTLVCAVCGATFRSKLKRGMYCSPSCKQYAYMGRKMKPKEPMTESQRKAHWAKVMAEVHAPIGDDEPLRRYVG